MIQREGEQWMWLVMGMVWVVCMTAGLGIVALVAQR